MALTVYYNDQTTAVINGSIEKFFFNSILGFDINKGNSLIIVIVSCKCFQQHIAPPAMPANAGPIFLICQSCQVILVESFCFVTT